MARTLWVATRKGLFALDAGRDWALGAASFLGDPLSMVLDDPRDGTVYAGLNLGHFGSKLHRSSRSRPHVGGGRRAVLRRAA